MATSLLNLFWAELTRRPLSSSGGEIEVDTRTVYEATIYLKLPHVVKFSLSPSD